MMRWWLLLILATANAVVCAASVEVQTVSPRPNASVRFLFLPQEHSVGSVIMLPGGTGYIGILDDGNIPEPGNFLVRTREMWRAQGFQVAIVDAPSDEPGMSDGFRRSAEHSIDLAAVAAFLKQRAPVPVWLVGTSRGTISAAAAAIHLGESIDGVVLTSSMVRGDSLLGLELERLSKPVLVVHHRDDVCKETPFSGVRRLLDRLTHAQVKALIAEEGGISQGNPCGAFAHHGYNGIESKVVKDIADWIQAPKSD